PTVTDADLVLGYLGADSFLGGDMRLDVEAARRAIDERVARPLRLTIEEAAWGIHDLVNENMARAAAIHALEKARRISDYTMLPIGGAGPVHAAHIALKLGLARAICPLGAGVASAFGFLAAPTSFGFVQGRIEPLAQLDLAAVNAMLDRLQNEGEALLATAGTAPEAVTVAVAAAMRYLGQGYEIDVPLPRDAIRRGDLAEIERAFDASYRQYFGRTERGMPIEIVSWRLVVSGPRAEIDLGAAHSTPGAGAGAGTERGAALDPGASADLDRGSPHPRARRAAWFPQSGGFVDTPVFDRYRLRPGDAIAGPALLEERESTVVVPPGASARCDGNLNLVITLAQSAAGEHVA
ncbi:MAG: hypothetical protein JSW68_10525, partial [Burkholderiales bacterium]